MTQLTVRPHGRRRARPRRTPRWPLRAPAWAGVTVHASGAGVAGVLAALALGLRHPALVAGAAVIGLVGASVRIGGRTGLGWLSRSLAFALHRTRWTHPGGSAPAGAVATAPERPAAADHETTPHRSAPAPPAHPQWALVRHTLLPGARCFAATDRDDRPLGLLAWRGRLVAVLVVEPGGGPVVELSRCPSVPLAAFGAVVARADLGLRSVQLINRAWPMQGVNRAGAGTSGLDDVFGDLPAVARRHTYVALSIDLLAAQPAIAARGGGLRGATGLLSSAIQRLELAGRTAGLVLHPLDPAGLAGALLTFTHPAELSVDRAGARQTWSAWAAPGRWTRCYAVTGPRAGPIPLAALTAALADEVSTAVTVRPGPDGRCRAQTWVAVTARDRAGLRAAARQLLAGAARSGLRLRGCNGAQVEGLRRLLPTGGG